MSQTETHLPDLARRPAQARIVPVIRALMAARGVNQVDLSHVLRVEQSAISRMLACTRKMSVDDLDALAEYFDVDTAVFYGGIDELLRSR